LGNDVRNAIKRADAVILSHHGIIGIGGDIFEAWTTIEHVEACVEILSIATSLGGITPLPTSKLRELESIRALVLQARERNF
jgi:ribulose-5-phosphate 4-epimerase/fuculose-1-phosphate aldolase